MGVFIISGAVSLLCLCSFALGLIVARAEGSPEEKRAKTADRPGKSGNLLREKGGESPRERAARITAENVERFGTGLPQQDL